MGGRRGEEGSEGGGRERGREGGEGVKIMRIHKIPSTATSMQIPNQKTTHKMTISKKTQSTS